MSDKNKIIVFPGLKQRLMTLGLEKLEEKRFREASELLMQAYELDLEDEEAGTALLISLYEAGEYEMAKQHGKEMLHQGIGNYFEIVDIFLMILIQLGDYKEAADTINVLMEEREIPFDRREHFEKLLEFSRKRVPEKTEETPRFDPVHEQRVLFNESDSLKEQIFKAAQLTYENIYPYFKEITSLLEDPSEHPFVKSMLINVLKEHGVEKPVRVRKFTFDQSLIPVQLPSVLETPFYLELMDSVKKEAEHQNPALFEQIKVIIDRHFFLLYPFELEPDSASLWTASYLIYAQQLYDYRVDISELSELHHVKEESVTAVLKRIQELEEISLPIV